MSPKQAQALLERYRRNECTPDEQVALDRWFAELGSDQPPLQFNTSQKRHQVRLRLWSRITANIGGLLSVRRIGTDRQSVRSWQVAATIGLVIGLGWLSVWLTQQQVPINPEPAQMVVNSRGGEHRRIVLPDGSIVHLNGSSSLRFPARFTDTTRPVHLQGEAFFEIEKDARRPFTVWAGGLATTALGTSFNIRVRPGADTRVSLLTGKVRVQSTTNQRAKNWLLTPGQQLTYQQRNRSGDIDSFLAQSALAWRDRKLDIENEPLDIVLREVGQHYGVVIRFDARPLHTCRVTTRLDLRNSVDDAFRVLSFSHRLTIRRQAGGYVVTGAGCPP